MIRRLRQRRRLLAIGCAVAAIVLLFPTRAEAHLNSTGLGPVYDGFSHFYESPEDFLPVLALSLFAGLRGATPGRRVLFLLPAAWLVGGWAGLGHAERASTAIAVLSFALMGGLLAADAKLAVRWLAALSLAVGFTHGYLNGAGLGAAESPGIALMGIGAAVFILVALGASTAVPVRAHWARIALRVVGSWIVACGILMAGWALHR